MVGIMQDREHYNKTTTYVLFYIYTVYYYNICSFFLFTVVLLRACWMQGAEKCMQDGDATVCTCNEDLCNSSQRTRSDTSLVIPILVLLPTFIAVILLQ